MAEGKVSSNEIRVELYRKRGKTINHVVPEGQSEFLCGNGRAPTRTDGKLDKGRVMPFHGFHEKKNWCRSCRRIVERLTANGGISKAAIKEKSTGEGGSSG